MNINDSPTSFGQYLGVLRRRRWYLLTIIPAVLLFAVFLAFTLEPSYRSTSTILLEPSSIPTELVQTTVTSYADQQIELVQRRVMTPDRLEALVREIDPYPEHPEWSLREKARLIAEETVLERVDPITLAVLRESNAFSIHYHNPSPERAQLVTQRISDLFLTYNRQTRSERASETYEFLAAQAKDMEARIGEADQRIADFKAENSAALPETQIRNQATAERAERDLISYEGDIRAAEDRQALLTLQLSKINPTLGGTTGNPQTELATLQSQLADARVRYTPDHPDVKRLQRQIETLMAQTDGAAPATAAPNNPEYIAVSTQLTAVVRELAALRAAAGRARAQIGAYHAQLGSAPRVEQEYVELLRQRDTIKSQFQDIQNKLREADIARNLESGQQGARFTQIRAPSVASTPYSPNRKGIILLGIVLGAALGIGLVALAESADPTVRCSRDLLEIANIAAIASVPVLENATDRRRSVVRWATYATALTLGTAIVAVVVVMDLRSPT